MTKFLFLTDIHFGWERKNGHKIPLHDPKAIDAVLAFAKDFKPDTIILGGDTLDCAVISHHNKGKPGKTEGLRLLVDAVEARKAVIEPLEKLGAKRLVYHIGNHEDWLTDLTDEMPGLEGIMDIKTLLKLDKWEVIPQGGYSKVGKLTFIHGDQLSGGEHIAKAAVTTYETSIRFGHFHSHQVYTKTAPLDYKYPHTGVLVPCLCRRDPGYGGGKPNRWAQGFNYGYVQPNGMFNDYVSIIVDGKFTANGKTYGQ